MLVLVAGSFSITMDSLSSVESPSGSVVSILFCN